MEIGSMHPSTPIKAPRTAACAYAALALCVLALLSAPRAGASEAANLLGSAGQSSAPTTTAPAKASGAAPAQNAKQSAATAKLSTQSAKVVSTPKATTSVPKVTTSTLTTATQETSSRTNTSLIIALILGVLLLGGIAFVIVWDARSVAPVVEGMATGGSRNPEGRLRKRRAQAKAARRQRKRHRKK